MSVSITTKLKNNGAKTVVVKWKDPEALNPAKFLLQPDGEVSLDHNGTMTFEILPHRAPFRDPSLN